MRRLLLFSSFAPSGLGVALSRRLPTVVVSLLLTTEFFDEFLFGLQEAAWPAIRSDLNMSYLLVGLVVGVPGIVSGVLEIGIGVAGDTRLRKSLIVGGGVVYGSAILLSAASVNGWMLLGATIVLFPAAGAFVSLSQATLMDTDPTRHQHNMARWTFVGSIGVVTGTLVVAGATELGISWRLLFAVVGVAIVLLAIAASRLKFDGPSYEREFRFRELWGDLAGIWQPLRSLSLTRWLGILVVGNLMASVFLSFIALYFVDVLNVSLTQAALAVTVWTVVGLIGDFALIPLLNRINGMVYLRVSALVVAVVFTGFLLTDQYWLALVLMGVLGLLNAGWYSIPQGHVYSALPGRSGSVVSITSAAWIIGSLAPLGIGVFAAVAGLQSALWVLLVSPIVLVIAVPRR